MIRLNLRFFPAAGVLLFIILSVSSCLDHRRKMEEALRREDIPTDAVIRRIRERGVLVASTRYTTINYFVYRGEPMGFQYEMLKSFSDYLGVKLEIRIMNDLDESIRNLSRGECDLLASGLTITRELNKRVDFSHPILQTRQVLVQRRPGALPGDTSRAPLIRNPLDLAGKTVYIQKGTTYRLRLAHLSDEIGSEIRIIEHPEATAEELIEMVGRGTIDYTVCNEHLAMVALRRYSRMDAGTAISFPQHIAWATQKGAHGLQHEINTWLAGFQESRLAAILYHKYFKSERTARWAASSYHSLTGGRISEYDELIRKYSPEIGWDWRLLASLIYQESGFRPDARSWAGAFGLMQLMPGTAELLGVDSLSPPEEQIKAGVELIKRIQRQFEPLVPDPEERIRFVLAAYNAGNAHVYDAIRLAEKYGADPAVWENSVDTFLLNKDNPKYYKDPVVRFGYCQCDEPYWFVIEIMERYQHYLNVVKQ